MSSGELRLGGVFGCSGPGIKPLVLAAVYTLRRRGLDLPILGCGGVTGGADVLAYLSVGAAGPTVSPPEGRCASGVQEPRCTVGFATDQSDRLMPGATQLRSRAQGCVDLDDDAGTTCREGELAGFMVRVGR
ncbi:hypothetical protein ACIHCQ_35945 [Streptomyces sp. NPDC052236]|uniref:hypothetical protein n=1 Tax=Streptomyces sp. NPDC052236 TaxID=3365686 RepID=UPI0037D54CEB